MSKCSDNFRGEVIAAAKKSRAPRLDVARKPGVSLTAIQPHNARLPSSGAQHVSAWHLSWPPQGAHPCIGDLLS